MDFKTLVAVVWDIPRRSLSEIPLDRERKSYYDDVTILLGLRPMVMRAFLLHVALLPKSATYDMLYYYSLTAVC